MVTSHFKPRKAMCADSGSKWKLNSAAGVTFPLAGTIIDTRSHFRNTRILPKTRSNFMDYDYVRSRRQTFNVWKLRKLKSNSRRVAVYIHIDIVLSPTVVISSHYVAFLQVLSEAWIHFQRHCDIGKRTQTNKRQLLWNREIIIHVYVYNAHVTGTKHVTCVKFKKLRYIHFLKEHWKCFPMMYRL